ncbi:MAG TPA: DUF1427 family protein [Longimicrobium sp.]|jgi:XapX domain-containing protein|nr:DUF1427 family protein [Longimicrobium sp.]
MTRNEILGVIVALFFGALFRFVKLPIPAPPTLGGALAVLGVTTGYLVVDYFLKK